MARRDGLALSSQTVFTECLNDLVDYFLLADTEVLTRFQQEKGLSTDLVQEFTTTDSAELGIQQGVFLALAGITNLPYTVVFSNEHRSIFTSHESEVQHRVAGHVLRVESGAVHLSTLPTLCDWPENRARVHASKPCFAIAAGWYELEVVAGETRQPTGWEPTLEFGFARVDSRPVHRADLHHRYVVRCRDY